jgi:hypothetical protein
MKASFLGDIGDVEDPRVPGMVVYRLQAGHGTDALHLVHAWGYEAGLVPA